MLPVVDLLMFAATAKHHFVAIHAHIRMRCLHLVRPFIGIPENLMLIMRTTGALISGSSVLSVLEPCSTWKPNDLDIYVPRGYHRTIIKLFELEGFVVTSGRQHLSSLASTAVALDYTGGGIAFIIKMAKDSRLVDIVVSQQGQPPFYCIARFHSTAVMNFISADGLFSAYPILTNSGISLANKIPHASAPDRPTAKLIIAYNKYRERGYNICNIPDIASLANLSPNVRSHLPHNCKYSYSCPQTLRSTFDRGCMFSPFSKVDRTEVLQSGIPKHGLYRQEMGVAWCIGAEPCDRNVPILCPFVSFKTPNVRLVLVLHLVCWLIYHI